MSCFALSSPADVHEPAINVKRNGMTYTITWIGLQRGRRPVIHCLNSRVYGLECMCILLVLHSSEETHRLRLRLKLNQVMTHVLPRIFLLEHFKLSKTLKTYLKKSHKIKISDPQSCTYFLVSLFSRAYP